MGDFCRVKNKVNSRLEKVFYLLFFIYLGVIVFNTGYVFTFDTKHYLHRYTSVQPGYTIFIFFNRLFFSDYFKEATIAIQLLFSYTTILYFIRVLEKNFKFNIVIKLILFLLLTHPIYGEYKMCNKLVTEPIVFSFFLLFLGSIIMWTCLKKDKYLYRGLLFLSILILTRAQFLSVSIALLFLVWYRWDYKIMKNKLVLLVLIFTLPVTTNLVEKVIYGVIHGHFVSRQLGSMSLATLPFFLSDSDDVNLMPDKETKEFFSKVYSSLKHKKLLANQLPKSLSLNDKHKQFHDNYPRICNQTIHSEAKAMYNGSERTFSAINRYADNLIGKTIKPLFLARPWQWLKIFYKNVAFPYYSIGVIIGLLLLAAYLFFNKSRKILKEQSLLFFFSTTILGNAFLISISIHSIRRYYMYFDIVLALLVLLLLGNIKSIRKYIYNN